MEFALTPVMSAGGVLFKRDDLFRPFPFSKMNGSKLRQCMMLCHKNAKSAARCLITGTSILSPQGAIVAATARHLGVPCYIYYGGTTPENIIKQKYPLHAAQLGAHVIIGSQCGRTNVLNAMAQRKAEETGGFVIRYGFDLRNNLDCFVESVAQQVQNIPDNLRDLVIVVGSSITLIGVLYGIALYGKNIENIWGVGCAPNRLEKIKDYASMIEDELKIALPLDRLHYIDAFNTIKGYKYENEYHDIQFNDIKFHPRYEAKAFLWMSRYLQPPRDEKTLFWINGSDIK